MENPLKSLNWKITALFIGMLIFSVLAILFLLGERTGVEESNVPSDWKSYQGQSYQINYPPVFTAIPSEVEGGGKSVLLASEENRNFLFELQVYPPTLTSLEDMYRLFRTYSLKEEDVMVAGQKAKYFSGTYKRPNGDLQERIIVFQNKDQIYKLQMVYEGSSSNPKYDKTFLDVKNSFTF